MSVIAITMSRRTVETPSDGTREGGSRRPLENAPLGLALGVRALRVMLGGALALRLSLLLRALGALRRHSFLLLVHAVLAHRIVAGHVACGLLAAAHDLVQETHP